MAVHSAVASAAVELAQPVDRAVHRRRPAAFFSWAALGALGTYLDRIHESLGVVAYPNPEWVGEALPVSPAYLGATVGFFLLYTVLVGHRGRAQGLFGGRPLSAVDLLFAHATWLGAYCLSGYLGAPGRAEGAAPFLGAALLLGLVIPDLWDARKTWLPLYAFIVGVLGCGFEWLATHHGGYLYPVCPAMGPNDACLGSSVPLVWLFPLYLHVAIYVHRMLGGRHLLTAWARRREEKLGVRGI